MRLRFLNFQFVLTFLLRLLWLSKILTNIWFELTNIGIFRTAKRCWPKFYVNWGSRRKLKSAATILDLRSRNTELTLADRPFCLDRYLVVDETYTFLLLFQLMRRMFIICWSVIMDLCEMKVCCIGSHKFLKEPSWNWFPKTKDVDCSSK